MDPRSLSLAALQSVIAPDEKLKALLLDSSTSSILSLIYPHSKLLSNSVLFIHPLSSSRPCTLPSIHAIALLRPTAENIKQLRLELRNPTFDTYRLVFTNAIRRTYLEEIADADVEERVVEIREVYLDYFILHSSLLSLELCPCLPSSSRAHASDVERVVDGVLALLLSLKKTPVIRYHAGSNLCRNIAERVCVRKNQERDMFDFRTSTLVLVVDRKEDPVTPLLNQWTYEAMVHELIGIETNRVSLKTQPENKRTNERDFVLDEVEDKFYLENRFVNFGELGVNLKNMVDAFQKSSKSTADLTSIDDLTKFVANFPEFSKSSANIAKHVALAGELSRMVAEMKLLDVSQLEQDIAVREAEAEHYQEIMRIIKDRKVNKSDKLRLVLLYSLRYEETDRGLPAMKKALLDAGVQAEGIQLITAAKEYAGASKRSGDLFENRSFLAKAASKVRRGIGGVDNVYTQHEPLLCQTLDALFRGKLRDAEYPLVEQDIMEETSMVVPPPTDVIVVMAGGVTYEEAKCVSAINGGKYAFVPQEASVTAAAATAARKQRGKVVLLGTCVHNSTSFAVEIMKNANAMREEHFVRQRR